MLVCCLLVLVLLVFLILCVQKYEKPLIHDAVAAGDVELTQRCLELRADVNELDERSQGRTSYYSPIRTAADAGRLEIAKLLIDSKATIEHCGALCIAARGGRRDIVELLMKAGVEASDLLQGAAGTYAKPATEWASDRPELRDFILVRFMLLCSLFVVFARASV